jgi:hypothetical protein
MTKEIPPIFLAPLGEKHHRGPSVFVEPPYLENESIAGIVITNVQEMVRERAAM